MVGDSKPRMKAAVLEWEILVATKAVLSGFFCTSYSTEVEDSLLALGKINFVEETNQ